jgi:hypothetical protein
MRFRLCASVAAIALGLLAVLAAPAQSASPMASGMPGVGPHGFDFLIGTWTCKNSIPSPMGGPATTTVAITRGVSGSLEVHVSGAGFGAMGYTIYASGTKTWWNPSAYSNGAYGTESSPGTGKKSVWTGPITDAAGKTMQQRDTYTWLSASTFTDLYQIETGGTWKTEGNSTCTKA